MFRRVHDSKSFTTIQLPASHISWFTPPKWHITPRMIFGGPEPQNPAGKFPNFSDSTSQKGHFEKHDFIAKVVSWKYVHPYFLGIFDPIWLWLIFFKNGLSFQLNHLHRSEIWFLPPSQTSGTNPSSTDLHWTARVSQKCGFLCFGLAALLGRSSFGIGSLFCLFLGCS